MASRSSAPASKQPQVDDAVREHLDRILASPTFQQGDRLKRFLKFIVLEAVAGRRHELKEYVIGVQVFGKEETFDPRTDPIVRVQARRLRAKLVRYYREEGRTDEPVIELPKGGYAPVFKPRDTPVLIKRSVAPRWSAATPSPCCRLPTTARRTISSTSAAGSATRSSTA